MSNNYSTCEIRPAIEGIDFPYSPFLRKYSILENIQPLIMVKFLNFILFMPRSGKQKILH